MGLQNNYSHLATRYEKLVPPRSLTRAVMFMTWLSREIHWNDRFF
jgi:hypothetical protein